MVHHSNVTLSHFCASKPRVKTNKLSAQLSVDEVHYQRPDLTFPCPSWPSPPDPQENTQPSDVSARKCRPSAFDAILTAVWFSRPDNNTAAWHRHKHKWRSKITLQNKPNQNTMAFNIDINLVWYISNWLTFITDITTVYLPTIISSCKQCKILSKFHSN